MQIRAAIEGDLRKIMNREVAVLKAGVKAGTVSSAESLKEKLRAQVREAGLSQSVQKAWQVKSYPKGDHSGAASWVYSKSTRIHAAFDAGGTIVPGSHVGPEGNPVISKAKWLWIPLPGAVALELDRGMKHSKGNRERKWSEWEVVKQRFGEERLHLIPAGGQRMLLVADTGGGKSRSRKWKYGAKRSLGDGSLPLFLLVKRVRLGKRLDIDGAVTQAGREFMQHILNGLAAAETKIKG